ncbi:glucose 1-dehydrogenase [Effusibacillus lacus]|uniref:SDR family oxidoreductase n=1 Tax=Effusibacillus lacus TaxID=1348429 RepID=A0A292YJD0_9BACL|nr:glucose 1-dehydrogenase [Effusibacillus lacus]TCS75547.1 2-deoxy-D-gluconate 3-dehydrogenase [Effusibacillus lacus]GAX89009.1 SDR family oxidoreductase [Effusibacillus lacus]
MRLFDLSGKTALVTGGGRGLGRGIALALAEAGADVAVVSRSKEELENVCQEMSKFSVRTFYQNMDIRDTEEMKSFVAKVVEEQGTVDILVNAAGVNIRRPFLEISESDWDFVMDVNLKSVFLTSQIVLPYMRKQQSGRIINIASLTSEIGMKDIAAYCASKGGVSQITKAMAVEFAEEGILVNAIGPGYYKTKLTEPVFNDDAKRDWILSRIPMRRTGEANDLAGVAIFLASPASDYITGQTIYVDGGWLIS